MPNLDVSEVLTDPDFVSLDLVCERNAETVDAHGRAVVAPTPTPFVGVVTNDSGDILERVATGERVKGTINVITRFALTDGSGPGQTADIVQFRGARYTVSQVQAYLHFGSGFVQAVCDLIPLNG